jgi:putative CocE/NonD family hydrolase
LISIILCSIIIQCSQSWAARPIRESVFHDNFTIQEEMVPMRDGVKLYTLLLTPKSQTKPLPIILERTPYNASSFLGNYATSKMSVLINRKYINDNFVYVYQDIRGRFKSEGDYFMYRVPRGEFNKTETDETTDVWDTIDWLVKNIPNNGRVGVWGTSYPGWLTLAALRDPHPALAAAVPFNPVVDVWKADDWFHWGAFRGCYAFDFIYNMETRTNQFTSFPYEIRDLYTWMLSKGAVGTDLGKYLDDRHEMWDRIVKNPSYGPYWRDVAADQWFDSPSRIVPTLHVHGFWDQEDIYGAPAAYAALEKHDTDNDRNYFVAGPWYHGQHWADGSKLGDIHFDENTAKRFREDVLTPFLDRYLHEKKTSISPVNVFETGRNRWRTFDQWPPEGKQTRLYLQPEGRLAFNPSKSDKSTTEFISDPAKPVPYAPRPNLAMDYDNSTAIERWRRWLVEDQRFVDGRPDVATWISEPLKDPITIRGEVTAHLFAETTGSDADWVVKLIDVYPDDARKINMSGYQFMISADIFRGRYRESYDVPNPIKPNTALEYTIPLPQANHTFNAGHRLMVQIQSTWFPLYDRNPQTYVESIMFAPAKSYKKQTHRVHHNSKHSTYIEFQIETN